MSLGAYVRAELLPQHDGNFETAFNDLANRFAVLALELDRADRLRSYAYARQMPPKAGVIDDVPQPITDDWIKTGQGAD